MGVDFRLDVGRNCGANCSRTMYSQCSTGGSGNYSAGLYAERGATVVRQHAADEGAGVPLFLYTAFQSVHAPIQAPPAAAAPYQHLDPTRRTFGGMLAELDAAVGHVRSAFEAAGMWENTLTVFTTDNGGPVGSVDGKPRGIGGATGTQNWPLRGGKGSYYQGGVRGTAWVHGSFLHAPGAPTFELMHAVDWLPTFVEAAGGPAAVAEFEARGLPLDGKSQWGALVKGTPGPHEHILINIERDRPTTAPPAPGKTGCFGVAQYVAIRGAHKIIVGGGGLPNTWYHNDLPYHGSEPTPSGGCLVACNATGCMDPPHIQVFDVLQDEAERHNLAPGDPALVAELMDLIRAYNDSTYVEALSNVVPVTTGCPFVDARGALTPCTI